jgi:hypothetical protein
LLMQFLGNPNRSRNPVVRMNPRSCHVSNLRGNRARMVDIARGNARLWRFLVIRARSWRRNPGSRGRNPQICRTCNLRST